MEAINPFFLSSLLILNRDYYMILNTEIHYIHVNNISTARILHQTIYNRFTIYIRFIIL